MTKPLAERYQLIHAKSYNQEKKNIFNNFAKNSLLNTISLLSSALIQSTLRKYNKKGNFGHWTW